MGHSIYVTFTTFCFVSLSSDEEEEAEGLEILMEAPEGFRNSDEDRFSESQVNSMFAFCDHIDVSMENTPLKREAERSVSECNTKTCFSARRRKRFIT